MNAEIRKKPAIIRSGLSLKRADVVLLGIPYEKTVSNLQGTSLGPKAICQILKEQVEVRDFRLKRAIANEVRIIEKHMRGIGNLEPLEMFTRVFQKSLGFLRHKKFIIGLGGEHTISLPLVAAHCEIHGDFTVVQIDAHRDLRENTGDYENPPRDIAHSTVMRKIHAMGHPLVQIGIRSEDDAEAAYADIHKASIRMFEWPFLGNDQGIVNSIPTGKAYLSIDVDGFDPSVFPATGTSEQGGITWSWFLNFAETLFKKKEVIGMDIVEVAQGDDYSPRDRNFTAFGAAKLAYHLIGRKFCK